MLKRLQISWLDLRRTKCSACIPIHPHKDKGLRSRATRTGNVSDEGQHLLWSLELKAQKCFDATGFPFVDQHKTFDFTEGSGCHGYWRISFGFPLLVKQGVQQKANSKALCLRRSWAAGTKPSKRLDKQLKPMELPKRCKQQMSSSRIHLVTPASLAMTLFWQHFIASVICLKSRYQRTVHYRKPRENIYKGLDSEHVLLSLQQKFWWCKTLCVKTFVYLQQLCRLGSVFKYSIWDFV